MKNNIDNIFKNKLQNYNSPVSGAVWAGISSELNPPVRRSKRWLWLLLLIILIALLGTWYILGPEKKTEEIKNLSPVAASLESTLEAANPDIKSSIGPVADENESEEFEEIVETAGSIKSVISNAPVIAPSIKPELQLAAVNENSGLGAENIEEEFDAIYADDIPVARKIVCIPKALDLKMEGVNLLNRRKFKTKTLGDCFEGPKSKYLIAINTSLDIPFRSFETNYNGEVLNYLEERDRTESEMVSFNAGLQFGYIHPSGFLAKSGVQYTQINERFYLVKENVIKRQTQITIDTMYNGDGTYTIERDTSIVEVIGKEELKTINQFRMLDIPLILGYKIYHDRFSLEINTGIIFNIVSSSQGRILNQELVPSYYGKTIAGDFSPFKTQYGASLYGGVTLTSNRLLGRTQFYFEPNARYYFKSFSKAEYPFRQKYFVLGVSAGLRYYF